MLSPVEDRTEADARYRLARMARDARRGVLRWLAAHLTGRHRAGSQRYI